MRIWASLLFTLIACTLGYASEDRISIPLSKVQDGNIAVELVCRRDGMVGPFINTSSVGRPPKGDVTFFNNSDFIRLSNYFDVDNRARRGIVPLPKNWEYLSDSAIDPGYFIALASFAAENGMGPVERQRALTSQSRIVLLQVITSKFLGADFGGKKYVAEIDVSHVTNEKIAKCLEFSGYSSALGKLTMQLQQPLTPLEMKGACLNLYKYYDALAAMGRTFREERQKSFAWVVKYPTRERIDCFVPASLSQPVIAKAATDAASSALTFDYMAFVKAADEVPLAEEIYTSLRDDWQVRNLPALELAEKAAIRAGQASSIQKVYFQYSRILACGEALKGTRVEGIPQNRMESFKQRMRQIEEKFSGELNTDQIWQEATRDYQKNLSAIRYAATSSPTAAMDMCSTDAARLELVLGKMMSLMSTLNKDFGAPAGTAAAPQASPPNPAVTANAPAAPTASQPVSPAPQMSLNAPMDTPRPQVALTSDK